MACFACTFYAYNAAAPAAAADDDDDDDDHADRASHLFCLYDVPPIT